MTDMRTTFPWPLAREWARLGAPLRPDADDLARLRRAVQPAVDRTPDSRGLLLGVTSGLASFCDTVIALDISSAMLATLAQNTPPECRAVQGDWLAMPLEHGAFTASVCDLGLTLLRYPDDYLALFAQLDRVLEQDGLAGFRCAVAPDIAESPQAVMTDAVAGAIASFHGFKFRLAQALAGERRAHSIRVADVHEIFNRLAPDRAALSAAAGWAPEVIATIDAYKDAPAVYSFPTLAQLHATLAEAGWRTVFQEHGAYEMAERFPVLAFARRP